MASALDSLTATYTDSEGEEKSSDVEENLMDLAPSLADRLKGDSGTGTPGSGHSSRSSPKQPPPRAQLVSYRDGDAGLSDEEHEPVPMELESEDEEEKGEENGAAGGQNGNIEERSHIMEELWAEGVKLPPEPSGQCSRELQEKIERMWKRKLEDRTDYNYMIQHKKAFRNPSIYEKLILHLDIDELGTNFPPELYDGHLFGKESYYDELAKVQKAEMDRREKLLAQKGKLGDPKAKESQPVPHRKSKWDQGATVPAVKPGVVVVPSLVAAKVIPAFGSLTKK